MAIFGPANSGEYTPATVAAKRRLAEQLMSGFTAVNPLGALAKGLRGAVSGHEEGEANRAESEGQKRVAEDLKRQDWMSAMSQPFITPSQSALASALMGREDRAAQWAREDARAAQAAAQPDWGFETINGDLVAFNKRNPGAGVQTVFDGPEPMGDPFTLGPGDIRYAGNGTELARGAPAAATMNVPSGYRLSEDGNLEFIPGGPADPASAAANKGDTEQTRRAKQLATMVNPQLGTVDQTFNALTEGGNQAASAVNFGTGIGTTPEYQQATNALSSIAQSYLYSVSGAAAPAEEVRKLVQSVTPVPFESEQSVADKKARVQLMVDAINLMAQGGSAPPAPPSTGGIDLKSKYGLE